ncbi:TIGR02679 family protein [Nocardia sp. NPDC051030]|uniref:TIGR02679 family protein n=1 Tax=Nocardia sp. NPDC051030 TaxID=3155162 RepID=UPI00341B5809
MADRSVRQLSPALGPLWVALHRRLSTGHSVMRVKVGPLDDEQRAAIADFFGMARLPGEFVMIAMRDVEQVLLDATGVTVREAVAELIGPVGDRATEKRNADEARQELWHWLTDHEVVRAQPVLKTWAEATRRNGLIGRSVDRSLEELERALRVVGQLPGAGTPLAVFADSVLGDPHGLDEGPPVHGLVVRALATIYGIDPPTDASGLRGLWDRAGIACDELSSTTLAAGLRVRGNTVVARILGLCADAGEAAALTLRQLRAVDRFDEVPERVWVVENPSVLALTLTRFEDNCPPMVCTSGWPSGAAVLLLERLAGAGAQLHYHGDFDGEGLRIAANIVARVGANPWRMTTADYLAAVGSDAPPVGRVTPVPWDAELSEHMRAIGASVPEERVAHGLLDELAEYVGRRRYGGRL